MAGGCVMGRWMPTLAYAAFTAASLGFGPAAVAQGAAPETSTHVEVPIPAEPAPKAPDAREKGVVIRRDAAPETKAAEVRPDRPSARVRAKPRHMARATASSRRAHRRAPRYRVDPAAAMFAGIANTLVGGVLTVFGEPHRYDYTYGYPVVVRPVRGSDYTYGPPRYRRW